MTLLPFKRYARSDWTELPLIRLSQEAGPPLGLLTRMTPHWLHVLYYRWLLGNKEAGKPGYPPYPTVFEDVISYSGMLRFAEQAGIRIGGAWATRVEAGLGVGGWLIRTSLAVVDILSRGRFTSKHNTLTFVMFARGNDLGTRVRQV